MQKLKLFLNNFLVYGLGGIINLLVPLTMIPLITRIMPDTSYYGIADMENTIVSFTSAFAVMGMYDAMYRMFFEKEDYDFKISICSTSLCFTFFSSIFVSAILILCSDKISRWFFLSDKYSYLVLIAGITTLSSATNNIILAPVRMQNRRITYLCINFLSMLLSYIVSLVLLFAGYYVIALPLGRLLGGLVVELAAFIINHKWFAPGHINFTYLKELLAIAIPTLPGFLIYWIFNYSDKLMITNIIGLGSAGVYSVGAKFGHASQLIYTAFAGGWQFFAFSTMKDDDQVQTNSRVFEYLGVIAFSATLFVCVFSYSLFEYLFSKEYLLGYIVAPYLFLAPLLQMLFQVAGNQFLVVKKTLPITLTLMTGAVVNVYLNLKFIPILGIEGAAIATLIGYSVSVVACVAVLMWMKLFVLSSRFIVSAGVMTAYIIMWRLLFNKDLFVELLAAIVVLLIYFLLYRQDVVTFAKIIINAIVNRRIKE